MKELRVNLREKAYSIIIAKGYDDLERYLPDAKSAMVVTDSNVSRLYLEIVVELLKVHYQQVFYYIVEAGEQSKSYEELKKLFQFMVDHDLGRHDIVFGLGGGVVGDLSGFAAASYMRGICFINLPTTLLAQNDSSIGGKTAINFGKTKNIIGAFYQPRLVYTNCEVLRSLPAFEMKSGLVEIIVHAIIKDAKLFSYLEENLESILELDENTVEDLIYWNCSIKGSVVEQDEFDHGERAILNFGHTFGHAIESAYDYAYSHGQCVAMGIIGACYIGIDLGITSKEILDRISALLQRLQIIPNIEDWDIDNIFYYLKHDKKVDSDLVSFILPEEIGKVMKCEIKDNDRIKKALNQLIDYVKELA